MAARTRCEESTPFLFPTEGYIGYLWDDSFRPGHRHQGIDIFTKGSSGETPVYAAYDGYITRLPDWKSSLIIRIPQDPLRPNQQTWLYYTHMADAQGNSFIVSDFPPGSEDIYVVGKKAKCATDKETPEVTVPLPQLERGEIATYSKKVNPVIYMLLSLNGFFDDLFVSKSTSKNS